MIFDPNRREPYEDPFPMGHPAPLFRLVFGKRLNTIRRLLRDLEWCGSESEGSYRCPICYSVDPHRGHNALCRMQRAINYFGRL